MHFLSSLFLGHLLGPCVLTDTSYHLCSQDLPENEHIHAMPRVLRYQPDMCSRSPGVPYHSRGLPAGITEGISEQVALEMGLKE